MRIYYVTGCIGPSRFFETKKLQQAYYGEQKKEALALDMPLPVKGDFKFNTKTTLVNKLNDFVELAISE